MSETPLTFAEKSYLELSKSKGTAIEQADLAKLIVELKSRIEASSIGAISGVDELARARAEQLLALVVADKAILEFKKALSFSKDQALNYRVVDIYGRVLSCRALSDEIEVGTPGQIRDCHFASLNRALEGVIASLLLEVESGRWAGGDAGKADSINLGLEALRSAYKLVCGLRKNSKAENCLLISDR